MWIKHLYHELYRSWWQWNELRQQRKDLRQLKALVKSIGREWSAHLTEREAFVVFGRTSLDFSFEQLAQNMNVTRERIRQIQAKALRKLKKAVDDESL